MGGQAGERAKQGHESRSVLPVVIKMAITRPKMLRMPAMITGTSALITMAGLATPTDAMAEPARAVPYAAPMPSHVG